MIVYFTDPDLTLYLLSFISRRQRGDNVRIMLAEGDSWFSIGGATSNLLMAMDDDDTLIVSCAYPGDTLRNMSDMGNHPFEMMLSEHFGTRWDCVLLSAGGNDLLDDVGLLIENGNLSKDLLNIALGGIERGYGRLISMVREHHQCEIHAHTYDYPVSDSRGGFFRLGPWVGNRLIESGVEYHRHNAIIGNIVDGLASSLYRMTSAGLTVHETRGTLTPPERWGWFSWQKDWRNEIHPSAAGYRKLAARWNMGK